MTVLVLTQRFDPTADLVIRELHRRNVPVFRCDPGDFPEEIELRAHISVTGTVTGSLRQGTRKISLAEVSSVYHRRPSGHRVHPRLDDADRDWAAREAAAGFRGVLTALGRPWLNHPDDSRAAEHKPLQLAAAARAGLTVPESLVTNATHTAHAFALTQRRTVYKSMTGGPEPGASEQGKRALYTTVVAPSEITAGVEGTAHLFQAWAEKAYEVRLTVVGDAFFAARIDAGSRAGRTDWRSDYDSLAYSPVETPGRVRRAVIGLMSDLRLTYGALDFVVTPDGRWVFLELNPNGQWGWIQLATGLPIAAAIADHLRKDAA
ncbi:ATP-grasp ribosomal peptide maturase [Nocardiopsis alba]|uniref:ATP-grasp ribosomal peptide maturase n=1 Tax=Nocardiopsis alba TaxID=53437 RepID=UPI0033C51D66